MQDLLPTPHGVRWVVAPREAGSRSGVGSNRAFTRGLAAYPYGGFSTTLSRPSPFIASAGGLGTAGVFPTQCEARNHPQGSYTSGVKARRYLANALQRFAES
jgi:hypothetical protein